MGTPSLVFSPLSPPCAAACIGAAAFVFVPGWHKPYTLGAPLMPGAVQAFDPCTKFYPSNLRGRGILPHSYSIGN